jgi:pimeloyl-ACP methyl ester carboxylesterase
MQTTVIMIHGAGSGGWEYDRWKPIFTDAGYGVIAHDLLSAAAGLPATTFDDYCQQARACVPSQQRVVLIGASIGGLLALKVAEVIKPAALVLVNSVPPAGDGAPLTDKSYPPIFCQQKWALKQAPIFVSTIPLSYSTITRSLALRPKTSGEYISSALAGGTTKSPGVVARATYE